MSGLFRSFYAKISAVFLFLLVLLSFAYTLTAFRGALRLIDEVEVKLNSGYALRIASEISPLTRDGLVPSRIKQSIHYMMVMNPRVEIYILNGNGQVLAFFADSSDPLRRKAVSVAPIREYLANSGHRLIEGEDPRAPGRPRPFSAAPLDLGNGQSGYVYVILGGAKYETALAMLQDSYFIRTAGAALLMILVVTAVGGLALFGLLTRRLRALTDAVDAFERGNLTRRVRAGSADDLDRLGTSFNRMAETIAADIDRMKSIDRLRRDLVANVSHDLRSPLASIRGYLETIMIRESALSDEERRTYLDIALRNTRTLERLVQELFDLSRLETDSYTPNFEQVSMPDLLQDVVLKLTPAAERRNVTLSTKLPRGVPLVRADIALIDRVLTNLIENAIRYTQDGGLVSIEIKRENDRVHVSVSDNGPGIAQEDIPFVFDRFYRAERSRARNSDESGIGTGSGLGLAIVKRIVELHGSDVSVWSEQNVGSRFTFDLFPSAAI